MKNIRQFKLTNGDEILCEVIDWADEDDPDLVVRHALKIVRRESATGMAYYTFAPWMVFQEGDDVYQTINSVHVIGEASPTKDMLKQYFIARDHDEESAKQQVEEYKKQLETAIDTMRASIQQQLSGDSDTVNVISFPGKGKLH